METPKESVSIIDMFLHPVFLVKDGIITDANQPAQQCLIEVGKPVADIIVTGLEEYQRYESGCLSLSLCLSGIKHVASVLRTKDGDLFHMQSEYPSAEFRTMALIAQQLRQPLSSILMATENLFSSDLIETDSKNAALAAQINKGLFQLLREVGNLSAAGNFTGERINKTETRNIVAIINEVMVSAKDLVGKSGRVLDFQSINDTIYCQTEEEMLERALLNLISNAVKFSEKDTIITAKLSRFSNKIKFTIQNQDNRSKKNYENLFSRFIRNPGIEDGNNGIGLGIPLIQHAASIHDGTLLIDQPDDSTIRFTLTMKIQNNTACKFSANIFQIDYLGGRSHSLVELSDILSASAYEDLY